MINPNNENSNHQFSATQKSFSNTPLSLRNTLPLSTNSFNSLLPLLLDSPFPLKVFLIHLDYLRVSSNELTKKSFNRLKHLFFSERDSKTINKPWHLDDGMPRSKKYNYTIESKSGIILGYTKKAKYRGINTRYVYDIMIQLSGSYFANLSLLEQTKLINYLNSNWKLKCHRIDVATSTSSKELFPVPQIVEARQEGNHFGFDKPDKQYLKLTNQGW